MTANKLSYQQAQELLQTVEAVKIELPSIRLGQHLWNITPRELTLDAIDTVADFYYEEDEKVVYEKFYTYFVEQRDLNNHLPEKEV